MKLGPTRSRKIGHQAPGPRHALDIPEEQVAILEPLHRVEEPVLRLLLHLHGLGLAEQDEGVRPPARLMPDIPQRRASDNESMQSMPVPRELVGECYGLLPIPLRGGDLA